MVYASPSPPGAGSAFPDLPGSLRPEGQIFSDWTRQGVRVRGEPIRPRWGFSEGYYKKCGALGRAVRHSLTHPVTPRGCSVVAGPPYLARPEPALRLHHRGKVCRLAAQRRLPRPPPPLPPAPGGEGGEGPISPPMLYECPGPQPQNLVNTIVPREIPAENTPPVFRIPQNFKTRNPAWVAAGVGLAMVPADPWPRGKVTPLNP